MPILFFVFLLGLLFVWLFGGGGCWVGLGFFLTFGGGNKFHFRRSLQYHSEDYQENPLKTFTKLAVYSSPAIL